MSGESQPSPPLAEAIKVWFRIGLLSFGGPAAQIALMHREIVEERNWLGEKQFLNALSFCMLLPGPEAMQLATFAGWRLHGTIGGLLAGLLFVLPGAGVILLLATIYAAFGDVPLVQGLFLGVKAAVVIIVVQALLRVSNKALHKRSHWIIAALSFAGIFLFALPYPLIVMAAALYGAIFLPRESSHTMIQHKDLQPLSATLRTILIWLAVWLLPLLLLWLMAPQGLLSALGIFFSKLAVVTFGGAYAVLAYMAQEVVGLRGWLTAAQMMDGLGLAETTPGPLILVTQFVGFLAAYKQSGYALAIAATAVTLWATFVPCFLWIFAGAPYVEWLATRPKLTGALDAITAAVVGVILNLSIWFGLHVFFGNVINVKSHWISTWLPQLATFDWRAGILSLLAGLLLLFMRRGVLQTLALCGAAGVVLSWF